MKKTMLTLALCSFIVIGLMAQQNEQKTKSNTPVFKEASLGIAYKNYLNLKDALVASKADATTKEAAAILQASLSSIKNSKKVSEQAAKIANAASLIEMRKAFAVLSPEMASLVKGQLSNGSLYLEYCPMANNNTGGYWLSNEKEIKNPYFGDKMLKCGTVKETIQ